VKLLIDEIRVGGALLADIQRSTQFGALSEPRPDFGTAVRDLQ
jgi:hypothetical protein